ncbi:hypothetical protein SB48_HM08orf05030 [Heyndrickxia coagulans]|uniref:Uncharacterized protein n=1 Tax=Heyndrickxia coagulans TaxID=1398 RepID=A0AAN0WD94_HEYCO|nr:hypothetical protein SB48_HM08orf05030 [Heyndrickxia coagulans]
MVRPLLSFIPLMKDISDCGLSPFVPHPAYEERFGSQLLPFCPSSCL